MGTDKRVAEERLHTLKHISERLQRSVRNLQRDIKAGRLAIYRFGRSIRVAEADLQRYLAAHRHNPKQLSDGTAVELAIHKSTLPLVNAYYFNWAAMA